ncbi:MAG: DUF1588 domain-containing protein [Myxococcota bacterium]
MEGDPYTADPSVLNGSPQFIQALMTGVERIASAMVDAPATLHPCAAEVPEGEPLPTHCLAELIGDLGRRAWRRPVRSEEREALEGFYGAQQASYGSRLALQGLVQRILQASATIFRFEQGPLDPDTGVVVLTPHALADAVAFTLTDAAPDGALAAAADDGSITEPSVLEAHVRRLLAQSPSDAELLAETSGDDQTITGLMRFIREWLDVNAIRVQRRPQLNNYPGINNGERLLRWMDNETMLFFQHLLWGGGDGTLATALSADYLVHGGSRTLTRFHNLGETPPEEDPVPTVDGRRGILMHAGFMTSHDGPTARGLFIRERLLCQAIVVPPNVDMNLEGLEAMLESENGTNLSPRDVRELHMHEPGCRGCHAQIDPLGFPFDGYDDAGLPRDNHDGFPLDTAGEILGSRAIDGPVAGPVELVDRLAQAAEVRACFVVQLYTYVHGRVPSAEDGCYLERLQTHFEQTGGDIRELLVQMLIGEEMRTRTPIWEH